MSNPHTILIAGASGFVGKHLALALREAGHSVRAGSRDPSAARQQMPAFDWVKLDVDDPKTLEPAMKGADTLVYLVHHLVSGGPHLADHESRSARAIALAASLAGVKRIVYLGAPVPSGELSPHLAARLKTGEILRAGEVPCIELRASMIVGAGSESWLICRDLALRLPVMILPRWTASRSAPIGIDDVVFALMDAVTRPVEGSVAAVLPGPEVLSGRQILERIAHSAGIQPIMFPVPLLTPRLSSLWLKFVTRADFSVARQLIDGLICDVLPKDDGWWLRVPEHQRVPFDEAIARALRAEPRQKRIPRGWERVIRKLAPSTPR